MHFHEGVKAVAKGQFAVWYDGNELVGSGVIE
jgi:tRNA U34 2-thiouridine synthase MnmA/TrmU